MGPGATSGDKEIELWVQPNQVGEREGCMFVMMNDVDDDDFNDGDDASSLEGNRCSFCVVC